MMTVTRGTTPTLTFIPGADLTQANNVYVTFRTGDREITKSTENDSLVITPETVSVRLAQADTLAFAPGVMLVRINWTFSDGSRMCSDDSVIYVRDNFPSEVLE